MMKIFIPLYNVFLYVKDFQLRYSLVTAINHPAKVYIPAAESLLVWDWPTTPKPLERNMDFVDVFCVSGNA